MLISATESHSKKVGNDAKLEGLASGVIGKSQNEVMSAIIAGVSSAYKKHQLPLCEVTLPSISPFALGAYMQWRMLTTIYLARLMHINPFDQPNVEDYKQETPRLLTPH